MILSYHWYQVLMKSKLRKKYILIKINVTKYGSLIFLINVSLFSYI